MSFGGRSVRVHGIGTLLGETSEYGMRLTVLAANGSRPGLGGLLLLGCAVVLNSPAAQASDAIPSPLIPMSFAGDPGEAAVAGVHTALDPTLYNQVKASSRLTLGGFVLGRDEAVDLELEQFDVLTSDALLIVADGANERATPRPDVVLLRGSISGDAESVVFLALSPDGTNGFIRSGTTQFVIAADGAGGAYVYNTREAGDVGILAPVCQGALPIPGAPAVVDDMMIAPGEQHEARPAFEATNCRTIRVAVDTDFEYRSISRFTSDAAAQTYALSLWGAVSEIYRRDTNVSLAVPYLRIWSANTDPYPDGSAIGDRLGQLVNHWRASQGSVSRDITHILSGTTGGGVAYLTVLCNNTWGYGADGNIAGTFPKPLRDHSSQNWDVMVTAHELGHNFAAPHTHSMTPVIDGCGNGDCTDAINGTIMSYCHTCAGGMSNILLKFHERTLSEAMLPYLAGAAASCGTSLQSAEITAQPEAFHAARAGTATTFTVGAAGAGLAYSWTFNTKPLVDGTTINGAIISGATTPVLRVANLSTKDIGSYRATVSNSCSSVSSNNASLSVRCAADLDLNSVVDLADFFEYFNCFDASDPCAEMNSDDSIDLADFFAFLNAFDKGC